MQINGNTPILHEPTPRLSNGQKAAARLSSQVRQGAENSELDGRDLANSSTNSPTNSNQDDHLLTESQNPMVPKLDLVRDFAARSASRRICREALGVARVAAASPPSLDTRQNIRGIKTWALSSDGNDRDAGDTSNVNKEGTSEECSEVASSVLRLRSRMCVAVAKVAAWSSGSESDDAMEKGGGEASATRRGGARQSEVLRADRDRGIDTATDSVALHARVPRTWTPETPPPDRASRSLNPAP